MNNTENKNNSLLFDATEPNNKNIPQWGACVTSYELKCLHSYVVFGEMLKDTQKIKTTTQRRLIKLHQRVKRFSDGTFAEGDNQPR